MGSLARPATAASPITAPSWKPGFWPGGDDGPQEVTMGCAASNRPRTSRPMIAAGVIPKAVSTE